MSSHEIQQQALEVARLFGIREAGGRVFGDVYRREASELAGKLAALSSHRRPLPSKLTLKGSQEIRDEEQRRAVLERLERAQAARGAKLVRAAGETILNSDAPSITPDTVWTGDYQTLVELFQVSLFRVNAMAAYLTGKPSRCWMGFLGGPALRQAPMPRAHEQP